MEVAEAGGGVAGSGGGSADRCSMGGRVGERAMKGRGEGRSGEVGKGAVEEDDRRAGSLEGGEVEGGWVAKVRW